MSKGHTIELNDVFDFLDRCELLEHERNRLLEIARDLDVGSKYMDELVEITNGTWAPE